MIHESIPEEKSDYPSQDDFQDSRSYSKTQSTGRENIHKPENFAEENTQVGSFQNQQSMAPQGQLILQYPAYSLLKDIIIEKDLAQENSLKKCAQHIGEDLQFYSFSDDKPLCSECLILNRYQGQDILNIQKTRPRLIQICDEYFLDLTQRITSYNILEEQFRSVKQEFEGIFSSWKFQIDQNFNRLKQLIESKHKEFIEEIDIYIETKQQICSTTIDAVKLRKSELEKIGDVVEKLSQLSDEILLCFNFSLKKPTINTLLSYPDRELINEAIQIINLKSIRESISFGKFQENMQSLQQEICSLTGLDELKLESSQNPELSTIANFRDTSKFLYSSLYSSRKLDTPDKHPSNNFENIINNAQEDLKSITKRKPSLTIYSKVDVKRDRVGYSRDPPIPNQGFKDHRSKVINYVPKNHQQEVENTLHLDYPQSNIQNIKSSNLSFGGGSYTKLSGLLNGNLRSRVNSIGGFESLSPKSPSGKEYLPNILKTASWTSIDSNTHLFKKFSIDWGNVQKDFSKINSQNILKTTNSFLGTNLSSFSPTHNNSFNFMSRPISKSYSKNDLRMLGLLKKQKEVFFQRHPQV